MKWLTNRRLKKIDRMEQELLSLASRKYRLEVEPDYILGWKATVTYGLGTYIAGGHSPNRERAIIYALKGAIFNVKTMDMKSVKSLESERSTRGGYPAGDRAAEDLKPPPRGPAPGS